jgi:hypothetical protein
MRDRHIPRLCRSCQAPMARQEDACWHCGTNSATQDYRTARIRLVSGGASIEAANVSHPGIATTRAGDERAAIQAHLDANRWIAEDGSLGSEATLPSGATRGRTLSARSA